MSRERNRMFLIGQAGMFRRHIASPRGYPLRIVTELALVAAAVIVSALAGPAVPGLVRELLVPIAGALAIWSLLLIRKGPTS